MTKTSVNSVVVEKLFAPISSSWSAFVTVFSKQFQQSLFKRNSLSNLSAGNIRPISKGLGTEVFLLSPYTSYLSFNSWQELKDKYEGYGERRNSLMYDTLFQKDSVLRASLALPGFGSSALLTSYLPKELPISKCFSGMSGTEKYSL